MSDEWNWGQEPEKTDGSSQQPENTDESGAAASDQTAAPEDELNENVTYHYKYTSSSQPEIQMVQEAQTMEIITLPAIIQILPEIHPKTAVLSPNLRNPDMRIIRLMNRRRSLRKKRKEDITDFIMIRQHLPVLEGKQEILLRWL